MNESQEVSAPVTTASASESTPTADGAASELSAAFAQSQTFLSETASTFRAEAELNRAVLKSTVAVGVVELLGYLIAWCLALALIGYGVFALSGSVAFALIGVAALHALVMLAIRHKRQSLRGAIGFDRTLGAFAELAR